MNIYRRLEIINSKSVNNKNKVKENDNMAQVISSEEFNNLVQNTEGIAVVDFFATWCGPCKMLSPIISEIANEYSNSVKVCTVNVDENQDLVRKYNITSVPTLIFFKKGMPVKSSVGFCSKPELDSIIKELL